MIQEYTKTARTIFVTIYGEVSEVSRTEFMAWLSNTGRMDYVPAYDEYETSSGRYTPRSYWEDCHADTIEQHLITYLKNVLCLI